MIEKICAELVELYQNSESEFFDEALALIKAYMPQLYHSIFLFDKEGAYRTITSDITDEDEILFWERALRKEPNASMKTCFCCPVGRVGIRTHIVIPLFVKEDVCGAWVLESKTQEEIRVEAPQLRVANLLALFVRNEILEKQCIQNLYLDAQTELPGKNYFLRIVNRLRMQKYKVLLGVFRIVNYREGIRLHGNKYMEDVFLNLLVEIKGLGIGNVYVLSEDSVALLINESEQEGFAGIKQVMNHREQGIDLVGAFLSLDKEEDIMTLLEEVFSVTPPGNIWRREQNPIASLFLSAETTEKEEEESDELTQELVEKLLFDFMEGV